MWLLSLWVSQDIIPHNYWASCAHYQLKKTQINHSWGTRPCLDILFHFSFAGNVLAWSFCCILFDSHLSKWHLPTNILICNVCMYYVSKLIQSYLMKDNLILMWLMISVYIFIIFLCHPAKYMYVCFCLPCRVYLKTLFYKEARSRELFPLSGWLSAACAHEKYWMRSGLFQLVVSTPAGGRRWDMERGKVRIQLHL